MRTIEVKMKAIVLNNRLKLISRDNDWITITIQIPLRNLQNLQEKTGCKILKKQPKILDFNHHAGIVANVTIWVAFNKIEPYLKRKQITKETEGINEYLFLLDKSGFDLFYHEQNLLSDDVALYAFGNCWKYESKISNNTLYYNKYGKKISLAYNGGKYINFKGEYWTNKKY